MTQREEFEAWHTANYKQPVTKWSELRYANTHVQSRWQGWQAAYATYHAAGRIGLTEAETVVKNTGAKP